MRRRARGREKVRGIVGIGEERGRDRKERENMGEERREGRR